jgi:purine-binding chemotaxis protein CheW
MDIAEIRKKAKAKDKANTKVKDRAERAEPAVTRPEEPVAEPVVSAAQEGPAEQPPGVLDSADALVSRAPVDALDRLFAVTDEFALATEASYADSLENQAEAQRRNSRQYLGFHLADEEYALDITLISEIIKVREFTDIPRSPECILGVISLRGVVVPVFDLRRRLNLGASEIQPTSRIVVSQQDDITVGLLVDSINQVVNLADDDLEPPPGVLSGLDRDMVASIGRCHGRMIILLNLKNVLNVALN